MTPVSYPGVPLPEFVQYGRFYFLELFQFHSSHHFRCLWRMSSSRGGSTDYTMYDPNRPSQSSFGCATNLFCLDTLLFISRTCLLVVNTIYVVHQKCGWWQNVYSFLVVKFHGSPEGIIACLQTCAIWSLFTVCTALSASPFDSGNAGDDCLCSIPRPVQNMANSSDENWGPLSALSKYGKLWWQTCVFRASMVTLLDWSLSWSPFNSMNVK